MIYLLLFNLLVTFNRTLMHRDNLNSQFPLCVCWDVFGLHLAHSTDQTQMLMSQDIRIYM
jgi:hypothetical protein